MEKVFLSIPTVYVPKMSYTSCNVIDEGKQFQVKIDISGIKKNEIKPNVTKNSLVSAKNKE